MAKREAPSEQSSTPPEPSRNDGITIGACALCGKGYGQGDVVQAMAPEKDGGPIRRVHMRCFHERVIMERAMRHIDKPNTPSI